MIDTSQIRAFFACDIDQHLRDQLQLLIQAFKKQPHADGVKWENPEKIHVTLRFMGQIELAKVSTLTHAIHLKIQNMQPFTVDIAKIIAFPSHHPHVIALAFKQNENFLKLYQSIEESVVAFGFEPEKRGFLPHATLGRIRGYTFPDIENISIHLPKNLNIHEIVLYQSETKTSGSVYTALEKISLHK